MYFKPFINLPIGSKGYDNIKRPLDDGWIQCDVCGRRIEITNNKIKYCEECAKEEWKKYNRDKQRQYYKLNSV